MSAPKLADMLGRVGRAEGQTRAARTVEYFGYVDFTLGLLLLLDPWLSVTLLHVPALTQQGENYLRLVGLLVSGLGLLYVVSGRLNAQGFVFASLLDRPMVPGVMVVLWYKYILPGPLALAFSISDFSGFLWTLSAWRKDERRAAQCADFSSGWTGDARFSAGAGGEGWGVGAGWRTAYRRGFAAFGNGADETRCPAVAGKNHTGRPQYRLSIFWLGCHSRRQLATASGRRSGFALHCGWRPIVEIGFKSCHWRLDECAG